MKPFDLLASLLVSDNPRLMAEKTLAFLVAHSEARGGAVVTAHSDEPSLFVSSPNLKLKSLAPVAPLFAKHETTLRTGVLVQTPGYVFAPLRDAGELVGALYLERPTNFDAENFPMFATTLAKAVMANPGEKPSIENYLASTPSDQLQRDQLVLLLNRNEWNISRVARILGVTRRTIYLKLNRYRIKRLKPPKKLTTRPAPAMCSSA